MTENLYPLSFYVFVKLYLAWQCFGKWRDTLRSSSPRLKQSFFEFQKKWIDCTVVAQTTF